MGNVIETNKNICEIKSKTNKKFMLLSVFGIIFVVMGHCNGVKAFLNNVFILFIWLYSLLFRVTFLKIER